LALLLGFILPSDTSVALVGALVMGALLVGLVLAAVAEGLVEQRLWAVAQSVPDSAVSPVTDDMAPSYVLDYSTLKAALTAIRAAEEPESLVARLVTAIEQDNMEQVASMLKDLWTDDQDLSETMLRYLEYTPQTRLRWQALRERYFEMLELIPTFPIPEAKRSVSKRATDIAISLGVLVLALPLVPLVVALVVWQWLKLRPLSSVIFYSERVGQGSRRFRQYRFRSRAIDRVSEKPIRTTPGDILMYTGLDSIPTYVNVLKGDMSVVGPNPLHPSHVMQLQLLGAKTKDLQERFTVKPGMFNLAQIDALLDPGGRKCIDYLKLDIKYVEELSGRRGLGIFTLDVQIMWQAFRLFWERLHTRLPSIVWSRSENQERALLGLLLRREARELSEQL